MILLTLPYYLSITGMINRSIVTDIFPAGWKAALVKPIPKFNSPKELKDLRPISLLPCLSKFLGKVVYDQLSKYCESHDDLDHDVTWIAV